MTSRFADTFFYLALIDERDEHHGRVLDYMRTTKDFIVTTRWVLAETANALSGTRLREEVACLLRDLEADPGVIVPGSSDALYQQGLDLYAERQDKEWSLTDCISFLVMEEYGITEALTGDHHFEQAGYRAIFAA